MGHNLEYNIKEHIKYLFLCLFAIDFRMKSKLKYILNPLHFILFVLLNVYYNEFKWLYFYLSIICIPAYFIFLFSVFPRNGLRNYFIKYFGEEKGYDVNCILLLIMFFWYGATLASVSISNPGTLINENTHIYFKVLGIIILVSGLFIKVNATVCAGRDAYFLKDLFLQRNIYNFTRKGVYKYFDNPMYGVGYLNSYGLAIFYESILGFIVTLICQIAIYSFFYKVELKHIKENILPSLTKAS